MGIPTPQPARWTFWASLGVTAIGAVAAFGLRSQLGWRADVGLGIAVAGAVLALVAAGVYGASRDAARGLTWQAAGKAGPRVAQMSLAQQKDKQILRVSVPSMIDKQGFDALHISVSDIIKDLTGCACLSGIVDVIWEERYRDIISVDLSSPASVGTQVSPAVSGSIGRSA